MDSYNIVLEEEGRKRELVLTPDHKESKSLKKQNLAYTITEKGKDLGRLVFKAGKYHYEGDEEFGPDDINLIAPSLTSNRKETEIESAEDDLDDDEDDL